VNQPVNFLDSPPAGYAGRTRYTQLEYEALLANASIGIAFTRDRRFFLCNPKFAEMFGWRPEELIGQPGEVVYPSAESYAALGQIAVPILSTGRQLDLEWVLRRRDGSTFLARVIAKAIDPQNTQQGTVWIAEDITERKRAQDELQRVLREQELILGNATVGIAFVRNRIIQRCNRYLEEMVGAGAGELVGRPSSALFASDEDWLVAARRAFETPPGEPYAADARLKRADGSTFLCYMRGRRIDAGDPEQEWIWSYQDVTAEREADMRVQRALGELERAVAERTNELQAARARAQHLADHDPLTGLPNRRLLEDRLTQALALSRRNRQHTAVMFIDLDRFKSINDSLGHAVGDTLLKEVTQRLLNQLRVGDTICRIGGDEFVVVLPEVKRSSDVAQVAHKVIEQLSAPVPVEGHDLIATASIGIAVFPEDGEDAETLIRNADAAMYAAKQLGRASYQFFTEQMNQAASHRIALESDLRRALGKEELCLHYQAIVEAASGKVTGHEALLRWNHPERGLVLPGEFIQLAEETGLILRIGEWVLREACRWAKRGARQGRAVSVNLSPRQFNDPRLVEHVQQALKDSGLAPRLLELEITESTAMQQTDATLATLEWLKVLGVTIAIDDFGTGYSSLAYLKRFPVDKLKIDRTFVADAGGDDTSAIVPAIIALAHALGVSVIAEGVETGTQREFLQRCGCDYLQGSLIGKPEAL